jgi:kinesin family protein C2/C3
VLIGERVDNQVLDLKGNIRVFCRPRPASNKSRSALTLASDTELACEVAGKSHAFTYDCVFSDEAEQAGVFAEAQPLIVSVLDGYHACILAYGQTGSGKTHTMQGYSASDAGVNTRAISEIFAIAKERERTHSYTIKVTLIEIYNETLRDLLEPRDASGKDKALDIKLASSTDACLAGYTSGTCVPGLYVAEVHTMEQVLSALSKGEQNRSVAGTDMNQRSSRSHMVLTVFVEGRHLSSEATTFGKLHLIDLAGSERLARSGAEGQQLKEAQNINR